ncbi:MAG TPA: LamG-like jellyroll fold domain-containing protein [Candidatus Saccharimonadales bacterium]|nr:LamG-like jellyroll fold domain-containing protein [Candidatus Saccharimonadales bacterium]
MDAPFSAADALTTYTNLSSPAGLSGLISWYQAEGNALDSTGTNNGTVSTPKVFSFGPGKVGQAFFPQGGIAVIPDSPVLEPTNLTLQVWIKSVAPNTYRYMIAKSRGAGGISYALYTGSGSGLIFFVNLAGGGGTILSPSVPASLVWDGAWHLATGVWDGTASHIYLDGVEFGTGTTSASGANGIDYSSPNPLIFGDYQTAGGLPFVGLMDEVQLYNRALSPAEILTSYAGSNLVSWWNANTNANDSAGSNNGTLLGGASYGPSRSLYGTAFNTIGGAVKIPDSASLRPTNITVEPQVNGTAPGTNKYIISKSYNSASSSYAIYTGAGGGLQFYVTLNGLGKVASPDPGTSIWDGNYHLVDGTYDGQKVHLYVDGIEVGTGTTGVGQIQYGTSQSSGELLFGDFTDALSAANFTGSIDEIKIYNTTLSAAQVDQNSFKEVLIINQPQNQNLVQGGTINLSVSAQGPAPLGYQWSFNGTNIAGATNSVLVISNAQPAQAGQYNVLITGGLAKYTAGVSGQALQVGAGALVEVPNNPAYETQNFTVQLYARAKAPGLYQYMFSKSRDPAFYSSSYGFYTGGSGGMIWFVVLSPPTAGSQAYGFVPVDAGTNVWDGGWHQLTGTWDGEFVNLYVDGALNKSVDSFGGTVDYQQYFLNGDVLIGDVLSPPSQYHFSGDEDEVKYFDHALTATDVMDSYTNKTGFGATNGLVSWYKLDGNTLDSARHNDGRIVPAPASLLSAPAFVFGASATFSAIGIAAGNFHATLTGPSGQTFIIQRSSDLINWTSIQTNTVPFTFSDPVISGSGGHFYRAKSQ